SVVTGGPGTGKTTTAAKILILCSELFSRRALPCRIALCAPTGKAAAHLHKSIRACVERMEAELPEKALRAVLSALPDKSYTLHRLLGYQGQCAGFRHNSENPLPYDIIIADEMSMADISLAAKFVDAVSAGCRLVFLGDRDQLSSVEAGSVLGDICDSAGENPYPAEMADRMKKAGVLIPADCITDKTGGVRGAAVYLTRSRRFSSDSGIGKAARLINEGNISAYEQIAGGKCQGVSWVNYPAHYSHEGFRRDCSLQKMLADMAGLDGEDSPFSGHDAVKEPEEYLERMKKFQILCALRRGAFGADAVNAALPLLLRDRSLLSGHAGLCHGTPVLITENCYHLKLFNGDIGVAFQTKGVVRVFFPDAEKGTLRS
ncbi:MAG: AAA family ATPase, partial [Spirochaetota bacterium]